MAKVTGILRHWGVQLILASSRARPAILLAGKGRGGMFLFLLFLHFHSCYSFFPYPLFHLHYYIFYILSPFLWETTQNDPQGLTWAELSSEIGTTWAELSWADFFMGRVVLGWLVRNPWHVDSCYFELDFDTQIHIDRCRLYAGTHSTSIYVAAAPVQDNVYIFSRQSFKPL